MRVARYSRGMGDESLDGYCASSSFADGVCDRLGLLIFKAGATVVAGAEPELEQLGICGREYTALAILCCDAPSSQQELAKLMGKAPAIVVAIVDELEGKGLVERVRSPEDRRRITVCPTPAGRRTLTRGDAITARIEEELLGELDAGERAQLHALMRRALKPSSTTVTAAVEEAAARAAARAA